tara:strand:+ start:3901 stop:5136 length:1236 start_codon:yes stop_codon:yes gene_type:complete
MKNPSLEQFRRISASIPKISTPGVKFKISIIRAKTGLTELISEGENLILDSGLTLWGSNLGAELTQSVAVGTSTVPTQRDSSTTTCSQALTTVTASAAFFEAGDVGRLLKFDTGEEKLITTFTSTTIVEVDDSATVAADEFTIWYVDQTGLQAESARGNTRRTDSGDNETTLSAGVFNHKRTHLMAAVGAGVTYNEIGWAVSNTPGNNLFNRAIISGGATLVIGDQLLVESNLEIVLSPQTSTAQADVGAGGFNSAGTIQYEGIGHATVSTSGGISSEFNGWNTGTGAWRCGEPSWGTNGLGIAVGAGTNVFGTFGSVQSLTQLYNKSYSVGGQTVVDASTRRKVKSATIPVGQATSTNINWIGIGQGNNNNAGSALSLALRIRLTSAQTKLSTETLALSIAFDYGRTLTN